MIPRPHGVAAPRAHLLVGLLLAALAIAALLAYETHRAARSHRATAERLLRDYAAATAADLGAAAARALEARLVAALNPLTGGEAGSPFERLPSPERLAGAAAEVLRCPDRRRDGERVYFRLDFRDSSLATAGPPAPAAVVRWIGDTVRAHFRTAYRPDWRYALVFGGPPGAGRVLVYGVKYAEHLAPLAAYGFVTCAEALGAPLFGAPPVVPAGAGTDPLLAVAVFEPGGGELFRGARYDPRASLGEARLDRLGGLTVRAALGPAVGPVPGSGTSRVALLLALFALAATLALVALVQLRREQRLARLHADFASGISHELRTPLAEILLYAETLAHGRARGEAERAAAVETIVQEARRLAHMVENVLHFARGGRGAARLDRAPQPLLPLVRRAVAAWSALPEAGNATVRVELDDSLRAPVDPGAFRQILVNLLDNAAKYGPEGQTVTIRGAAMGGRVRLLVDDQGPGVPREERERVWRPFVRLDRPVEARRGGTGLGLAVTRRLALEHGGATWIEDAPGGGARVVVELPAAQLDATDRTGS